MKNIILLIFLTIVLTACAGKTEPEIPEKKAGVLTARVRNENDELIRKRLEKIAAALKLSSSVLTLETADTNQKLAQDLALKDARLLLTTKDAKTDETLFNKVFSVYPPAAE